MASHQAGLLRAAFRDVHGPSLHGFALLLTLGDRAEAARLASQVMAEGTRRAATLRHPERAAAWLRHRVVRSFRDRRRPGVTREEKLVALGAIGVDEAAFEALSALSPADRAALIAGEIERLAPLDLELVLEASPATVRRRVSRARLHFLELWMMFAPPVAEPTGPLALQISGIAGRTLSSASW
jgi:DNA-directed RNA polymerase specialized sigma24 family protein